MVKLENMLAKWEIEFLAGIEAHPGPLLRRLGLLALILMGAAGIRRWIAAS